MATCYLHKQRGDKYMRKSIKSNNGCYEYSGNIKITVKRVYEDKKYLEDIVSDLAIHALSYYDESEETE